MTEDRKAEVDMDSSNEYLFQTSFEDDEPLRSDSFPTEEDRSFNNIEPLPSHPSLVKTSTETETTAAADGSGEVKRRGGVVEGQEKSEVDADPSNDYLFQSSFEDDEPLASDSFSLAEDRSVIECRIYDGSGEGNGDETDEEKEEGRED